VPEAFVPSFLTELPLAQRAYAFAAERHRGQRRDSDRAPFIAHPLEVASLLHNRGCSEAVVAAGILHDVVEDTAARAADVEDAFGPEVAGLVAGVTEEEAIADYDERKAALRAQVGDGGEGAAWIYAADKVAKVRELRARITRGGEPDADYQPRIRHYRESLAMLEVRLPGNSLVTQLRFELELLEALPPDTVPPCAAA
jgi:hypothetical protein